MNLTLDTNAFWAIGTPPRDGRAAQAGNPHTMFEPEHDGGPPRMTTISRQLMGSTADISVEREILCLATFLREGRNDDAADRLGITPHRLSNYLMDLYREMGVSGHLACVAAAIKLGWLQIPDVAA